MSAALNSFREEQYRLRFDVSTGRESDKASKKSTFILGLSGAGLIFSVLGVLAAGTVFAPGITAATITWVSIPSLFLAIGNSPSTFFATLSLSFAFFGAAKNLSRAAGLSLTATDNFSAAAPSFFLGLKDYMEERSGSNSSDSLGYLAALESLQNTIDAFDEFGERFRDPTERTQEEDEGNFRDP